MCVCDRIKCRIHNTYLHCIIHLHIHVRTVQCTSKSIHSKPPPPPPPPPPISATYNIPSHSTQDVNDPDSKPANGPLNLDAHVKLYGNYGNHMQDSKVKEDRDNPSPELVGRGQEGIVVTLPNKRLVKPADIAHTVHLRGERCTCNCDFNNKKKKPLEIISSEFCGF